MVDATIRVLKAVCWMIVGDVRSASSAKYIQHQQRPAQQTENESLQSVSPPHVRCSLSSITSKKYVLMIKLLTRVLEIIAEMI